MDTAIRHPWTDHAKEAKFCHECGSALVVGEIRHVTHDVAASPGGSEVFAGCSCGWREDFLFHPKARSASERSAAAMALHRAENAPGLRCPHEGDAE